MPELDVAHELISELAPVLMNVVASINTSKTKMDAMNSILTGAPDKALQFIRRVENHVVDFYFCVSGNKEYHWVNLYGLMDRVRLAEIVIRHLSKANRTGYNIDPHRHPLRDLVIYHDGVVEAQLENLEKKRLRYEYIQPPTYVESRKRQKITPMEFKK